MMTGIVRSRQNFARSSDSYSVEMCLTVLTVLCTTNTSAPASSAILPYCAAFCGMEDTAASIPASLIWRTRMAMSSSCTGSW